MPIFGAFPVQTKSWANFFDTYILWFGDYILLKILDLPLAMAGYSARLPTFKALAPSCIKWRRIALLSS